MEEGVGKRWLVNGDKNDGAVCLLAQSMITPGTLGYVLYISHSQQAPASHCSCNCSLSSSWSTHADMYIYMHETATPADDVMQSRHDVGWHSLH